MKRTIVLMSLLVLLLLLGCQEEFKQSQQHKQHPTTIQQMNKITEWVNAVNKKFAETENNLLFLYRHCVDPNSI